MIKNSFLNGKVFIYLLCISQWVILEIHVILQGRIIDYCRCIIDHEDIKIICNPFSKVNLYEHLNKYSLKCVILGYIYYLLLSSQLFRLIFPSDRVNVCDLSDKRTVLVGFRRTSLLSSHAHSIDSDVTVKAIVNSSYHSGMLCNCFICIFPNSILKY